MIGDTNWALPSLWGFPDSSVGKESTCNAGDPSSIPGFGRSPGEGKGYPLQYSGLENSMDCIVCGVAESDTTERLSLSLSLPLATELTAHQHNKGHIRKTYGTSLIAQLVKNPPAMQETLVRFLGQDDCLEKG